MDYYEIDWDALPGFITSVRTSDGGLHDRPVFVTLTLTRAQAEALYRVGQAVGGYTTGPRGRIDEINRMLEAAGVTDTLGFGSTSGSIHFRG